MPDSRKWAAFLRGVNVGGINIAMADLRACLTDLGLTDVATVLASGNAVFTSDRSQARLTSDIEVALGERFGYQAWVIVRPNEHVTQLIEGYPFNPERPDWQPYIMLCRDPERREELLALADKLDPEMETVAPGPQGVIYWEVRKGQTVNSVFGKYSAKAKFKSSTTTRNYRTFVKVSALGQ